MSHEPSKMNHVTIVGGGITGLSTAWYLQQNSTPYTIVEQSKRWGGKIQTELIDGVGNTPFVIECAADAFLTVQKPWAMQLAQELGLNDEILPTNDAQRNVYVLKAGQLALYPRGMQLIVPTDFDALEASPLLSEAGKQRMKDEVTIAPRLDDGDESLADFVRRRFGQEALDIFGDSLMAGIYNADPNEQSLLATFPRFRDLERQHGSLIKGMQQAIQRRKSGGQTNQASAQVQHYSAFISFKQGTEVLTQELAAKLSGEKKVGIGVESIGRCEQEGYRLTLSSGEVLQSTAVVLTTPAAVTSRLVRPLSPTSADQLDTLRTVSTGTISLAFRQAEIKHPLNGFGVVIPRLEKRPINAITWTSTKFSQRAPDGYVLLRVFFGGNRNPQMMERDDSEILTIARQELRTLMGIDAQPVLHRIYRWFDAQPQYDVGHLDRLATLENHLPPNMHVAGCPYYGVGIPDCVRQAQETTTKILNNCEL